MDKERLEIMRRVLKAMRHPSARGPLTQFNSEGGRQVVICLDDDSVEYATQRVVAVGGAATVVIPHRDGLVPLGWEMCEHGSDALFESDAPVHPSSTLGMLLEYFEARGGTALEFHVSTGFGEAGVRELDRMTVPI